MSEKRFRPGPATRTLADARPSLLRVLRKVQLHIGWTDGALLRWLEEETCLWSVDRANAGDWVRGATPNTTGPGVDPSRTQVLSWEEAELIRDWHTRPWTVMTADGWDRWARAFWRLRADVELLPPPALARVVDRLDPAVPVAWWPRGRRPAPHGPAYVRYTGREAVLAELSYRDAGGTVEVDAAALFPSGRVRFFRRRYWDWYEGRLLRDAGPVSEGRQLALPLEVAG